MKQPSSSLVCASCISLANFRPRPQVFRSKEWRYPFSESLLMDLIDSDLLLEGKGVITQMIELAVTHKFPAAKVFRLQLLVLEDIELF